MKPLLFALLVTGQALATIIHVPDDLPTVQLGLDATAPGDTVLVARGVYQELLESPSHGITLCSNFIFTQDSTDIVETVLDGNLEGTVLNIGQHAGESYLVCGMTFQGGMGVETGIYAGCVRAGAINVDTEVNLSVSDCVFRENQSEDGCSVMRHGRDCSGFGGSGSVVLSRIHFEDNLDNPSSSYASIELRSYNADYAELTNLVIDAGTSGIDVMNASFGRIDSLVVSDIRLLNGDNTSFRIFTTPMPGTAPSLANISTVSDPLHGGSHVRLDVSSLETNTAVCSIQNLFASGVSGPSFFITSNDHGPLLEIDNVEVSSGHGPGGVHFSTNSKGTIRNLHFHHNTVGDSISLMPSSMIFLNNFNLYDSHIHDNTVIIPSGWLWGAILSSTINNHSPHMFVENVRFEDNLVIDLDDYSNPYPDHAPGANYYREMYLQADTLTVRNVQIRRSRQPNHCPELAVPDMVTEYTGPGGVMGLGAELIRVEDLLMEDCDDGGLHVGSTEQGLFMNRLVLRNVDRFGIRLYTQRGVIQNVLIDGTVAKDNWLWRTPEYEHYSRQRAINIVADSLWLRNVTVMNCDSMRSLVKHSNNFAVDGYAEFQNGIFADNSYSMFEELIDGSVTNWSYCYSPEALPGVGNIVGQNPLFDPELGPPFLATESPCIDAGNPEFVYNDIEDPAYPGWAQWPSQGSLRNDIGFTGGPGVDSLAVDWLPVEQLSPETQPRDFVLGDPYPNPFNPTCRIPFSLAHPTRVRLRVFNLAGQLVHELIPESLYTSGNHVIQMDAGTLASGVYLVKLEAGETRAVRKVVVLK
jgi:hypothetical protein